MKTDFLTLGIKEELGMILKQNGIVEPTQIQVEAIPPILAGKDVIAQAQTGTGKTLAFLLPMMEGIDKDKSSVQTLIITPTRELAIQITAEARKLASYKDINILAAYGGQDVEKQVKKLKGNIHMVIGTPGRLLDHLRRKSIHFGHLRMLVLDEADQMLHMGFLTEVEEIIRQTNRKRQTMLFSATIPKGIRTLSSKYMGDPIQINVQSKGITLDEIEQVVVETTDRGKQDALFKMLEEYRPFMAMIFCRTKRRATALNEALQEKGFNSEELHGDLTQGKREKVMKSFRKLELQLLVATDVAARGLDIEGMTHVFNYDIPENTESYIHRIGRTGRAGQTGVAITFTTPRDRETLKGIEKGIQMTLKRRKMTTEKHHEDDKPLENSRDHGDRGTNKFRKSSSFGDSKFGRSKKSGTKQSSSHKKDGGRGKSTEKHGTDKKHSTAEGRSRTRSENTHYNKSARGRR